MSQQFVDLSNRLQVSVNAVDSRLKRLDELRGKEMKIRWAGRRDRRGRVWGEVEKRELMGESKETKDFNDRNTGEYVLHKNRSDKAVAIRDIKVFATDTSRSLKQETLHPVQLLSMHDRALNLPQSTGFCLRREVALLVPYASNAVDPKIPVLLTNKYFSSPMHLLNKVSGLSSLRPLREDKALSMGDMSKRRDEHCPHIRGGSRTITAEGLVHSVLSPEECIGSEASAIMARIESPSLPHSTKRTLADSLHRQTEAAEVVLIITAYPNIITACLNVISAYQRFDDSLRRADTLLNTWDAYLNNLAVGVVRPVLVASPPLISKRSNRRCKT